jgi:hypothetical protein
MTEPMETQPPPKLSKEQHGLILYVEQYYWRTSSMPVFNEAVCAKDLWDDSWADGRFLDALAARGIPEHLLRSTGPGLQILTEQQMAVANVLLDVLDSRSRIKKLTEMGISTQQYNLWLRDPVYRQYCLDRAESLLIENQPVAHMSLINRVSQGDLGAVKYFNSLTGRYREREKAQVEVNVNNQFGAPQLIAIVEIIQKYVKDPETLELIGRDILELNTGPDALQRAQNRLSGPLQYEREIVYSKAVESGPTI